MLRFNWVQFREHGTTPGLMLILGVLCLSAYAVTLKADFKSIDDYVSIVDNPQLRSWSNLDDIFSESFFKKNKNDYYRPLVTASFLVEYQLCGLNAAFYYLTNILIHFANAVLVFLMMNLLLKQRATAFAAALLFVLHPVHWEAVANIPGRAILLCAFFYLSSFLLFCLAFSGRRPLLTYGFSLTAFILALLSKESALVLPGVIFCYLFFLPPPLPQTADMPVGLHRLRSKPSLKSLPRILRRLLWIAPFVLIEGIYLMIRESIGILRLAAWDTPFNAGLGFLSFLRGVITYVRILIIPLDLQYDRGQRLITSLFSAEVLGVILFFGLLTVVLYCLWKVKRISPVGLFFLCWFAIDLIPVSQVLVPIKIQEDLLALSEHFLYVPSLSFCLLIVWAFLKLKKTFVFRKWISENIFYFVMTGYFAFFYLTTIQQAVYASEEIAMYQDSLRRSPKNTRILNAMALAYARSGLFPEAEQYFRKVLEIVPASTRARIGLGKSLVDQGRLWAGLKEYERVHDPRQLKSLWTENKRIVLNLLRDQYQSQIKENPYDPRLYYSVSVVYAKAGQLDQAVQALEHALFLSPDDPEAWFNFSSISEARGDLDRARYGYRQTITLAGPGDPLSEMSAQALMGLEQRLELNKDSKN